MQILTDSLNIYFIALLLLFGAEITGNISKDLWLSVTKDNKIFFIALLLFTVLQSNANVYKYFTNRR